jgi:hypothetical protein
MPSPRKKSKKRSKKKSELDFLLDIDYIKENTPNLEKMKTTLKKMKNKRVGLFANKNIKKGETISYYLVKVYKSSTKILGDTYSVTLYNKNGLLINNLTGNLCPESLQVPAKNGITYWAYFSNEPSMNEKQNCYLDFSNSFKESKDKLKLVEGDFVRYKLIASKNIKKGDEILWCYGYAPGQRDYKTICEGL